MSDRSRLEALRAALAAAGRSTRTAKNKTALDAVVTLDFAADAAQRAVYQPLQETSGLSEGKLLLLSTLKANGSPMSVGMLARALGVRDATTSIMVSRMLKEEKPLIERTVSGLDRRAVEVRLTAEGSDVLASALKAHRKACADFAGALSEAEQLLLIGLLEKLAGGPKKSAAPQS